MVRGEAGLTKKTQLRQEPSVSIRKKYPLEPRVGNINLQGKTTDLTFKLKSLVLIIM